MRHGMDGGVQIKIWGDVVDEVPNDDEPAMETAGAESMPLTE
jgi:hypothetical protein